MKNKCCHRCLMSFDRDSRMIEHLMKKNICKITNPEYDSEYDKKLMLLFNQENFNIKVDFDKYAIKFVDEQQKINYQCQLCKCKLTNKLATYRHLMNVCLHEKYTIKNELMTFLNEPLIIHSKKKIKLKSPNQSIKLDDHKLREHIFEGIKSIIHEQLNEDMAIIKNELKSNGNDILSLKNKIKNNESKPINNIHNLNFQVLCLDSNKNCLDLLSERCDDFVQALEFVKDCALSEISGDVRLIEKVYLEGKHPAMWYLDRKRHKIGWIDESGKKHVDNNGKIIIRKLASSLQNGYLKGVNYLIQKNLDSHKCPNKFLADYDIQAWNNHIYNLREEKYQLKLLSYLDLPNDPTDL